MSTILRFETNKAQEIVLAYADGKPVEGKYGPQLMFSLRQPPDSTVYFPPIVGERLKTMGVQPGERIDVCKAEKRDGPKKWTEWEVSRVDAISNGAQQPAQPAKVQEPAAAPVSPASEKGGTQAHGSTTNGQPPLPTERAATKMEDALCTVAAALLKAERYAKAIGYEAWPKQFTGDEVVRLANTMLINGSREANGHNGGAR